MKNVFNLIIGIADMAVLSIPFRKGWAVEQTANKRLRYALNLLIGAVGVWNLCVFSEANSNIGD